MLKNYKLLLLGLLTPLFISVSSANTYLDDLENYVVFSGVNFDTTNILGLDTNNTNDKLYCVSFSGTYQKTKTDIYFHTSPVDYSATYRISVSNSLPDNTTVCNWGNKRYFVVHFYTKGLNVDYKVYDFGAFLSATNNNGGGGSDCSSVESQLLVCQDSLSGSNSQLSQCQSDLSSCQNGCDTLVNQCLLDKSNLQSSYSGCLETNNSLNNYNDSLSQQLNQCLSQGSGSVISGDFVIYEYQLSWFDGLSTLHLPITNSLNLPYGYRGYLDDGVLSIKNLESSDTKLKIDDDDFKNNVISSYSTIYLFFVSSGLFLIFLYAIRRYFIGLKSIK